MIFQLRTKNKTICDVEITAPNEPQKYIELSASVLVAGYSQVLAKYIDEMPTLINKFEEVEELRGWLWENYFGIRKNVYTVEDYNNVVNYVKNLLKKLAHEYDLCYVED